MKLIIHGAAGRMGRALTQLLTQRQEDSLLYPVDKAFPISHLSQCRQRGDCVIDFSHPSATETLLNYCIVTKTPVVICTTGHTGAQHAAIRAAARQIPVFHSSNMSLGIALLADLVQQTARRLPEAEITIIETHHSQKQDAPSGTARLLRSALHKPVVIHSVRRGNLAGIHQVIFSTENQTITLRHEAHNRDLYAQGALTAAAWLVRQPAGLYGMQELLQ